MLHDSGRCANKIMLQIDKFCESSSGNLTFFVFTVEDAVLRIYRDVETNMQKSTLE